MAVTFTREFYINFGLFLFACLALALSIWAFAKPCKKDGFGNTCNPTKLDRGVASCNDIKNNERCLSNYMYAYEDSGGKLVYKNCEWDVNNDAGPCVEGEVCTPTPI